MNKVDVTRKRKFASGILPFWIIVTDMTKMEFMQKYGLQEDLCRHNSIGQAISRLDINLLDTLGTRILSGETVEIEIKDGAKTIIASTMDGSLSNEIRISDLTDSSLILTTRGGFQSVSYPFFAPKR